jgi:hypothetical protein
MRELLFLFACIAAAGCASEDPQDALARQCGRLRDHLVELRLEGTKVDVEAHRAAIKGALGDRFVEQCTAEMTTTQVSCALAATDSSHALECTRGSASSTN